MNYDNLHELINRYEANLDMLYNEEEIDSCPAFYNYTAAKRHSH